MNIRVFVISIVSRKVEQVETIVKMNVVAAERNQNIESHMTITLRPEGATSPRRVMEGPKLNQMTICLNPVMGGASERATNPK